jgi:hypothetical protein
VYFIYIHIHMNMYVYFHTYKHRMWTMKSPMQHNTIITCTHTHTHIQHRTMKSPMQHITIITCTHTTHTYTAYTIYIHTIGSGALLDEQAYTGTHTHNVLIREEGGSGVPLDIHTYKHTYTRIHTTYTDQGGRRQRCPSRQRQVRGIGQILVKSCCGGLVNLPF